MDNIESIYTMADAERDLLLGNDVDDYMDAEEDIITQIGVSNSDLIDIHDIPNNTESSPYKLYFDMEDDE